MSRLELYIDGKKHDEMKLKNSAQDMMRFNEELLISVSTLKEINRKIIAVADSWEMCVVHESRMN